MVVRLLIGRPELSLIDLLSFKFMIKQFSGTDTTCLCIVTYVHVNVLHEKKILEMPELLPKCLISYVLMW